MPGELPESLLNQVFPQFYSSLVGCFADVLAPLLLISSAALGIAGTVPVDRLDYYCLVAGPDSPDPQNFLLIDSVVILLLGRLF